MNSGVGTVLIGFVFLSGAPATNAIATDKRSTQRNPLSSCSSLSLLSDPSPEHLESDSEMALRQWWTTKPFQTTELIMTAILQNRDGGGNDGDAPLLKRHGVFSGKDDNTSPFEANFEHLFGGTIPFMPAMTNKKLKNSQRKRHNFGIMLAYRGSDYCGWQLQPNNHDMPSVQGNLQEMFSTLLKSDSPDIRACGRTDRGVSAIGQVCRVRTYQNVTCQEVQSYINARSSGSIKCLNVTDMGDSFHPTFGCTSRAYVYLIDLNDSSPITPEQVPFLNAILQRLEGCELDYIGMSYGKLKKEHTRCTINLARASCVTTSITENKVSLCVQLVGDRFLRRMVRHLVSTALRETIDDNNKFDTERLLHIVNKSDRGARAAPAPPDGLIFVKANF